MAKTRVRDEKFRLLLLRIPFDRNDELVEAAKELGLRPTQYALLETLKALNARKASPSSDTVAPH